ncbi:MAG: hypothetical protein K1X28_00335 [Parachlamydiales bacterium]|nr:hypothetical protein [Parachlamydiales bacterium]
MEVYLESDDPYVNEPQKWEAVGKTLLWASSVIGGSILVPALFKKKRVYTVISAPIGEAPAPVVEAQPEPEQANLPEPLRCPPLVRNKIVRLFTIIADEDVVTNGPLLWRLGSEIEDQHHVHPFTFLMNMPRNKIQQIFNSPNFFYRLVRIPTIMNGIERGMNRERNRLGLLVPAFAAHMQKEEQPIRQLIQAADWRGLVHYLFDINA